MIQFQRPSLENNRVWFRHEDVAALLSMTTDVRFDASVVSIRTRHSLPFIG